RKTERKAERVQVTDHARYAEWRDRWDRGDSRIYRRSGPSRVEYGRFAIPPGHLPGPGQCRLWYPNRPPGHQPPPFDCDDCSPYDGWVVYRSYDEPDYYYVTVVDPEYRDDFLVLEFESDSGAFVRLASSW
ncbi:MAG: hypothetical protein QUU85_07875, partial [Candidatus Eisenbacteria bacterium]|nr:hypothetical protein [Candidatus Eisenbacteria bacterium]